MCIMTFSLKFNDNNMTMFYKIKYIQFMFKF